MYFISSVIISIAISCPLIMYFINNSLFFNLANYIATVAFVIMFLNSKEDNKKFQKSSIEEISSFGDIEYSKRDK